MAAEQRDGSDEARAPDDAPRSDVRDAIGARMAIAVEEELGASVGEGVARALLEEALRSGALSAVPVDPEPLRAFVEGALRETLATRLGAAAEEPLARIRPLVTAFARIDEHHRSERPTSRPRTTRETCWVVLGPERAWAVDRLAEALGPSHQVVLAHEPSDLEAIAAQGAERVLVLLDRTQRWAGGFLFPPQWSRVLAPAPPSESLEDLAAAIRRLSAPR